MSGEIRIGNNGSSAAESFCKTFADVVAEDRRKTREWTDMLRKKGVKAAHSDDGWVKRDVNEIVLMYPYFGNHVQINDVIAIEDYRECRLIRIISVREVFFGRHKYYTFTEDMCHPFDMGVDNLEEYVEGTWFGC